MKQSEIIKKQIEEVKAEFERAIKEKVYDRESEDRENHDELWSAFWSTCGSELIQKQDQLKIALHCEINREIEVGDGVTINLWSDRHACTVIKRTAKTLTVQRDKTTLDPDFKPEWVAGGFAGHCTNSHDQKYTYERDENGTKTVFRWSEKHGRWQSGSDGSITLSPGRHEYYDYNF